MSKREPLGPGQESIQCPYCHWTGTVTGVITKRKQGISGGKATAALATFGATLLLTGLSRQNRVVELTCSQCHITWDA